MKVLTFGKAIFKRERLTASLRRAFGSGAASGSALALDAYPYKGKSRVSPALKFIPCTCECTGSDSTRC
jgi:hypothetical protein